MKYSQLVENNQKIKYGHLQCLKDKREITTFETMKHSIPKNTLFDISSMVLKSENNKEETESKFLSVYDPNQNAFCLIIDQHMKYVSLSKEVIFTIMDLGRELNIEAVILLVNKKNKDYVKIIKGMMIVGFELEKRVNTTVIQEQTFKIMKMNIKRNCEVEEIDL